jgi:hypothetical protein
VYLVDGATGLRLPTGLVDVHVNGAGSVLPALLPTSDAAGWLGLPIVLSYVALWPRARVSVPSALYPAPL